MAAFWDHDSQNGRACTRPGKQQTYLDVGHVLAVRVLTEERAGANDDIDTVNASLDGDLDIVHVASHVSEDLGLQAKLADGLAVKARLLRGAGRRQFDAVDSELIESLGNLDLGLGVEVGVGKLLALAESRLDDLEVGHVG